MTPLDHYRSLFESVNGALPARLHRLRVEALQCFLDLGFPTTRLEDWRYTDVTPIARLDFRPAPASFGTGEAAELAQRLSLGSGALLVFVNGRHDASLSSPGLPAHGLRVESLANLFAGGGAAEPYLASVADHTAESFTALNTAFLQDGALVHVSRGVTVREPVQLIFLSASPADQPCISHPRVLIVAESNSEVTVVEDHTGVGGAYLANAVTEIVLEDGARVDHYKLQREAASGYHIATVATRQGKDTRFRSHAVSLGSLLARVAISTTLDAEGSECALDGLYMASGRQHVDHHTTIDHRRPRCSSRELYKGVLDGKATGVFNGRVFVRPGAQKSDAIQVNKNLLLSDDAAIDTKPQLEIFADDVKCSHGATIGRLDEAALFYLRSRGIDARTARALLIRGFANELVDRLALAPVRAQVQAAVARHWGWGREPEEVR